MEVSWWWVCLTTLLFGVSQAVDLHLEGQADSVFFFQQSFGSSQQPLLKFPPLHSPSNGNISSNAPESRPLLRERLALISQAAQQGRIRVTYGPFEAKQSLPTKFLSLTALDNSTGSSPMDMQATLMDISAHVVNGDQGLRRESPVLRVLFHSGRHFHSLSPVTSDREDTDETAEETDEVEGEDQDDEREEPWDESQHDSSRLMETCIALRVHNPSNGGSTLTATCAPRGLEGVCLASLTLPYDWWASSPISPTFPSLSPGVLVHNLNQQPASVTAKPTKALRNLVELSYAVYQTKIGQCNSGSEETQRSSLSSSHERSATGGGRGVHRAKNPSRLQIHQKRQQPIHQTVAVTPSRFPPPSAILIQSARSIGSLRLLPNVYAPRDLLVHEEVVSLSPTLRFIASAAPLYPHSRFYVTVLLDTTGSSRDEPYSVVVRAKVKHGLKIISTQTSNAAWSLNFDVNGKHIAAAVTATRNFSVPIASNSNQKSQEMFTWLLAVNEDQHHKGDMGGSEFANGAEGVRALWSWTIRSHSSSSSAAAPSSSSSSTGHGKDQGPDEVKGKLTSRFEVLKDEVQSVFPIIKRRDLVNTAILTSRQVSEPLRIFMVTQAGKVADVTLQASCSSADESVLKVSSSCTSVYLDGSEIRGSTNATLVARYGNVESTSSLTVWVPELPLDIQMDDVKLNQISGWKVPGTGNAPSQQSCRLRYQQTNFEVFSRFYAEDHDSGRVSYLISRKTYLLITELVRKTMRVSDPRIAALRGAAHVEGLKPGKTELQILSPMSGQVIAARELRVTGDRVDATELSVRLITGLSMNVIPDPDLDSCFVAQVDAQQRLHAKYQEAILDLALHFSDGTVMPLRLTERSHYVLSIDSHNASILALTSPSRATIPRVLALGEGQAVLSLSLGTVPACSGSPEEAAIVHPLASAVTSIQVALTGQPVSSVVQNDARTESSSQQSYTPPSSNQIIGEGLRRNKIMVAPMATGGGGRSVQQQPGNNNNQGQLTFSKPGSTEFGVSENQLSLKDDSNALMTSGRNSDHHNSLMNQPSWTSSSGMGGGPNWHVSPLEMGLYALLAVFCSAIFVFVGTCVIYASRARKSVSLQHDLPPPPPAFQSDPSTPAVLKAPALFWNRIKKMNQKNSVDDEGQDCQEDGECGFGDIYEEQQRTDKGWIWLGRSTLPEPSESTPPPTADEPLPALSIPVSASNKRLSGISYTGSEVSVLITSRPADGNRLAYKAQLCFEPLADDVSVLTPVPNWSSIDSTTFTRDSLVSVNITANRLAAELGQDADEEEEPCAVLAEVTRRPKSHRRAAQRLSEQDTRRYARSWLMAGEAVPRDFNSNPSPTLLQPLDEGEKKEDDKDYNLATFLRHGSPDIKQANIVENPRCSTSSPPCLDVTEDHHDILQSEEFNQDGTEGEEDEEESAAVNYDRIISYLGILKETST